MITKEHPSTKRANKMTKTTEGNQAVQSNQAIQDNQAVQLLPNNQPNDVVIGTEFDEFCSPDFIDPNGRLPRIQAVRGEDPKQFGYFVPLGEMAKAGWADFDENQITEYTFQSGESEKGLLLQNPRMLVCPKSLVLAVDKKLSKETQSTVILGEYRHYKGQENVTNVQFFQIFLLNEKNEPLHQIPLIYKAKGTNQASFSVYWQQFCSELNTCFSIANRHLGASPKPKNFAFNSLLVFCPKLAREIVGDKQKSPALRVVGYEQPTLENWKQFFVGTNATTKQFVWQGLTPNDPLQMPALPASTTVALGAPKEAGDPLPF